jgi:predicted ABC-type transport system involved in lysophospholipase L1 biosynthesis ATPase subunit
MTVSPTQSWRPNDDYNCQSPTPNQILALRRQLNRDHGQTFVLVTHDPEVGDACDRVVRMRDGRVSDGTR